MTGDNKADSKPEPKTVPIAQTLVTDSEAVQADAAKRIVEHNSVQQDASALVPENFGRYKIERTLGEGAMGTVYLAHDSQLNRKVAIKVPKFTDDETKETIQRFYREARSAGTLRHANICPVYDVGEIDGRHYIAMAYIDGKPLSTYVSQVKPPTPRSAAMVIRKLALGLQEAHEQGIVHRDLKPANIMIDSRNEPVIMDFGLARRAEQSDDSRLTQAGTIIGTPAYMSPEQLDGRPEKVGPSSDIYALGVLLYELLTGTLPFEGTGSVISVIKEILTKSPPNPSEARSEVDSALAEICCKAMAKEENERHLSMKELAAELTVYLTSGGAGNSGTKLATTVDPDVVRLEEQCQLVRTLCSEGQFQAAESILQKIVDKSEPKTDKYATWAKKQLPGVQTQMLQQTQVAPAPGDLSLPVDLMQQLPTSSTDTNNLATETLSYSSPTSYSHSKSAGSKVPPWMIAAIAGPIVLCILLVGVIIGGWFSGPPGPPPPSNNGEGNAPVVGERDRDEDEDKDDEEKDEDEDEDEDKTRERDRKGQKGTKKGAKKANQSERQREVNRLLARFPDGVITFENERGPNRRFWIVAQYYENPENTVTADQMAKFFNVDENEETYVASMLEYYDKDGDDKIAYPDELDEPFWFDVPGGEDDFLDATDLDGIAQRLGGVPPEHRHRNPREGGPPAGGPLFPPPPGDGPPGPGRDFDLPGPGF